jgi:putative membrane protein
VPYDRIEDVSIEQKLLPRLFGLAQVKFETGAGGKDEISLAYLSLGEADRLRELVRVRKGSPAARQGDSPASTGETATELPAQPLFAMGTRRIVTFGLFEFSLVVFAVLLGAAQQLDFLLPFDPWEWEEWAAFAGTHRDDFAWIGATGRFGAAIAVAAGVALVAAVGVLTGVARTFAREYGFILERTAKGFRRRRGLFTRTDVVMPAHRVQAVQVRTRLIRRRFGWHSLKFVSLAQDAGAASHVVAPFAQIDEIAPIAAAAGFPLPEGAAWQRPSARAYLDAALIGMAVPTIPAVGLAFSPVPALAIVPVLAAVVIGLRQYFLWRHDRNAVDERQLYLRHGWLAPRLDIAARVKLQSVEIRQGPLARRGGYADLHLGLAGGTLHFGGIPLARARQIRDGVLKSIGTTDFARLAHAGG